jgi:ryanodine receptor 2
MTDELYVPAPLDTSTAALPEGLLKLTEYLAENAHENWAVLRISEGWKLGPKRDDANKLHPCLVPYDRLPDSEKQYDRNAAIETLKAILLLGYRINSTIINPIKPGLAGKPYKLSVKAFVRNGDGLFLSIRRSAASRNNGGKWDFPGGKVDPGEAVDQALVREVHEETGLSITVLGVVGAVDAELKEVHAAYMIFEARTEDNDVRLSEEHSEYRWLTRSELAAADLVDQFVPFARSYLKTLPQ